MPNPQDPPDIYSDFVQIALSDWGLVLGFRSTMLPDELPQDVSPGQRVTVPSKTDLKATVRLSQPHAKAFAISLRRVLKQYEERGGEIIVPESILRRLSISVDEW